MKLSEKFIAVIVSTVLLFLAGCGTEEKPESSATAVETDTIDTLVEPERSEDWLEIQAAVEEVIMRLRYNDKSGLYENEFEYLKDDENFDKYLVHGEISWANADSIKKVEIKNITFFERDSALIDVVFHFEGTSGKTTFSDAQLQAYYHHGKWIKPYMSSLWRQQDYEELIRQADEDSW